MFSWVCACTATQPGNFVSFRVKNIRFIPFLPALDHENSCSESYLTLEVTCPIYQWTFPYSCRVKPLIEMPMISPESHPRCQKCHAVRQVRILMGFLWISSLDTSGASQYIAGHLSGASQKVRLGLSQLLSSCDPRLYPVRCA